MTSRSPHTRPRTVLHRMARMQYFARPWNPSELAMLKDLSPQSQGLSWGQTVKWSRVFNKLPVYTHGSVWWKFAKLANKPGVYRTTNRPPADRRYLFTILSLFDRGIWSSIPFVVRYDFIARQPLSISKSPDHMIPTGPDNTAEVTHMR